MEIHSVYIHISSYPHEALFLVPWLDKHQAVWDLSWLHGIASCIVSQSTHRLIGGWELYMYSIWSRFTVLSPISICTLQSLCSCSSGSAVSRVSHSTRIHVRLRHCNTLTKWASAMCSVQTWQKWYHCGDSLLHYCLLCRRYCVEAQCCVVDCWRINLVCTVLYAIDKGLHGRNILQSIVIDWFSCIYVYS